MKRYFPNDESAFRARMRGGYYSKWFERVPGPYEGDVVNRATLARIFGMLHYLGSHAPKAIRARYRPAERKFCAHHLPYRASMRFANKFTAHRWL